MSEHEILLKLKREFTSNEAVQQLLKMLSENEMEVGRLKSELSEITDKLTAIQKGEGKTKKQWMQDEVFKEVGRELETHRKNATRYRKEIDLWRAKYFNLLANHSDQ